MDLDRFAACAHRRLSQRRCRRPLCITRYFDESSADVQLEHINVYLNEAAEGRHVSRAISMNLEAIGSVSASTPISTRCRRSLGNGRGSGLHAFETTGGNPSHSRSTAHECRCHKLRLFANHVFLRRGPGMSVAALSVTRFSAFSKGASHRLTRLRRCSLGSLLWCRLTQSRHIVLCQLYSSSTSTRSLHTMAEKVPLHGRLLAQWKHHAYPRECAYSHELGERYDRWHDKGGRDGEHIGQG